MYWIDKSVGYEARRASRQVSFECDTEADIVNLPTINTEGTPQGDGDPETVQPVKPGSTCFVIDTSEVYKLKSDNVWKKL